MEAEKKVKFEFGYTNNGTSFKVNQKLTEMDCVVGIKLLSGMLQDKIKKYEQVKEDLRKLLTPK